VPESAVPESAVPESSETVLAETVLAETVALKSHGSAERKALGSACWTAAPVPRRRNVSARGGVGSRAVPPLRARPYSQERATGLLLDYRGVLAGGTGSPTACLATEAGQKRCPKPVAVAGRGRPVLAPQRRQPRMHTTACLLRQALTKASQDTWQPVCRNRVMIGGGAAQGGGQG
jgi:hypothetical protein